MLLVGIFFFLFDFFKRGVDIIPPPPKKDATKSKLLVINPECCTKDSEVSYVLQT